MAKLLLLDLDGTIREPLSGQRFIQHPGDQQIIAGADKAIAHFSSKEYTCIGITNQGGVAAGHKSLDDCIQEQSYTLELFPQLHKIYFCPDFDGKQLGCVYRHHYNLFNPTGYASFRKPGSGMLEYARATHNSEEECWYIGDRPEDEAAASNAGINFLWASVWRDRFLPGIHEHAVNWQQLKFLEGI